MTPVDQLPCQIDLGQQTEETATLRVSRRSLPGGARWRGTVRGPYCRYARTLPADYPVDPDGVTVVTEPCYWTPALPFLYQLQVEAVVEEAVVQTVQQTIGLRRLDARDGNLYWEGRRTVLRGMLLQRPSDDERGNSMTSSGIASLLDEARTASASLWNEGYDAELFRVASEVGTPLIVDLRRSTHDDAARLSPALAPAVVAAIVDRPPRDFEPTRSGMLLAQAIPLKEPVELPDWAKLAAVMVLDPAAAPRWVNDLNVPVIAACPANSTPGAVTEARTQADRLQAALAPEFDFAGYFV